MPENIPFDSRKTLVSHAVRRLMNHLEGGHEYDFAISELVKQRQKLARLQVTAIETRAREFLNKRWVTYGTQFQGPWPLQLKNLLSVHMKLEGRDVASHSPWSQKFQAKVRAAHFVRLGTRDLARYVELAIPAHQIIARAADRERYGFTATEEVSVYATMYALIQAGPTWVTMDSIQVPQ
jgi:hypothetical protein